MLSVNILHGINISFKQINDDVHCIITYIKAHEAVHRTQMYTVLMQYTLNKDVHRIRSVLTGISFFSLLEILGIGNKVRYLEHCIDIGYAIHIAMVISLVGVYVLNIRQR